MKDDKTLTMRLIKSIILTITVSLPMSAQQRLASPALTVKEPTFARMSDAKVSWSSVDGADSYSVKLDGEKVDVIGNTLYLTGKVGQHTIEVIANSSDDMEQSLPAVACINVRDYGDGTLEKPYLIYDRIDWMQFADAVCENYFDNEYFEGYYVALASNIDFNGENIRQVGKNFATGFRGVFDGKGYTLKNAVLEGKGRLGLFHSFHGVMKDLKAENITVKCIVTKPADGRCAVICGGDATGKFYNCMVTDCSVNIGGEGEVGRYAGIIASGLNSQEALVERCIAVGNEVTVGNSHASAIVARVAAGTVSNCIAQDNRVYSGLRLASGIVVQVCGPNAIVNHCLSLSNRITAKKFYATGVAAEISSGLVVNCTSDSNVLTVEEGHSVGGVAGLIKNEGNLINCLSKNCTLNVNATKESFSGLLFANADKKLTGIILNCLVLSGSVNASDDLSGYIGIVGGKLADTTRCAECFYNEMLVEDFDESQSKRFYGFGSTGSRGSDYDSASPVKRSALKSMSSKSIMSRLNTCVRRFTSFGASEWIRGADGYPSIK